MVCRRVLARLCAMAGLYVARSELRRNSRLTVDLSLPIIRAIALLPNPLLIKAAIWYLSSRVSRWYRIIYSLLSVVSQMVTD